MYCILEGGFDQSQSDTEPPIKCNFNLLCSVFICVLVVWGPDVSPLDVGVVGQDVVSHYRVLFAFLPVTDAVN